VGGALVSQGIFHDEIDGLPIVMRPFADSKHGRRKANLRLLGAGILPGSVLTGYDLLGIDVRGRLQYTQ